MFFLYLDESGDLGFDFVNKKPSKFFTVCILTIEGKLNRRRIAKGIKITIRRKLNPKNKRKRIVEEMKGSSTSIEVKRYFYRKVEKIDFSIHSITLNKTRVYKELVRNKSRVYNWVTRLLLDNINFPQNRSRITLILDKSKGKREIEEFNSYIQRQLEGKIEPEIPFEINHLDSKKDKVLQAVDLFAWGVFRKYEKRDYEWFNIFKNKVKFDKLYLP